MTAAKVLEELAVFALTRGPDVAASVVDTIEAFFVARPELRGPPAEPARERIDSEIDAALAERFPQSEPPPDTEPGQ